MKNENLANPPRYTRFAGATGIQRGKSIDRKGGDYGGGLIRGFAVVSRGEALGHDVWCDTVFLRQVADAINTRSGGRKSRFTHPGLSSDGLGKFLGRTTNAVVDGDVVRADLHLASIAHRTPDGDLASYIMDFASETPEDFGASIVFEHDAEAESAFTRASGLPFKSPDKLNVRNLPHARLSAIYAVDIVDDPAANPSGMFHREQELAAGAEAVLAYALGLSKQRPDASLFGVDADRLSAFVTSFLGRRGLIAKPRQPKPIEQDRLALLFSEELLPFARSLGPQLAALGQTVK